MSKRLIEETLQSAKELGIRNILALRGDPPRGEEYQISPSDFEGSEEFVWAADLVRYIRKEHGDFFCIGVAGYPEGHSDESHPATQDPMHDMPYLLEKVTAGADFIVTQLFFDFQAYLDYERMVRHYENGAMQDVIIIPGLMPVQSFSVLKRTTALSHAKLPETIVQRLEEVKGNDEEVKRVGVEILCEIIQKIKNTPSPGQRGFNFYTLNLEKVVSFVLEKADLIAHIPEDAIDDADVVVNGSAAASVRSKSRRPSSPHNHIMSDSRSTSSLEPPSRATTLAITHGVGTLGREATWDDYPNGRFGDARSPAFGEIDGYGPSIHLSPAAARAKWGSPSTRADIGELFLRYLKGELDQLPWSEGSLNAETRVIERHLCRLIEEQGWWTIASQPAADGLKSSDPVFGWGPRDGFVFQKAFVEFWVPDHDWKNVLRPRLQNSDNKGRVSWYAASNPHATIGNSSSLGTNGHLGNMVDGRNPFPAFECSSPSSSVDAVTWGAFPGKEIVTSTLIEEISFRAWAEEAFGIWQEWERCYTPDSPSRKVIRSCREQMWLVNVIGQVYQEPDELWQILLSTQ